MATTNDFSDSDVVIGNLFVLLSTLVVVRLKLLVLFDSRHLLQSKMVLLLKTCG
jgi:hypothetical protein